MDRLRRRANRSPFRLKTRVTRMTTLPVRIACVHQGYELYGSDRCFVESVAALRQAWPDAEIEVVLPRPGPIVPLLQPLADRVVFEPLWVLRRKTMMRLLTLGLFALPAALWRAGRRLSRYDLVYVNTAVIADYALAARFFPGRSLLHIHEIAEGGAARILRGLALWSGSAIVFNSRATQAAYSLPPGRRSEVIYNGIAGPAVPEPVSYDGGRRLRVLMLGRIGPIKGQEILLAAIAALPAELKGRIEARLAGGAFENEERERALHELVGAQGLSDTVSIEPFVDDPSPLYRWADIVCVPSKRPESLGRVAIEAMAWGRPAIVSAIGGLVEVVDQGRAGWLVPPGEVAPLSEQLAMLIARPELLAPMAAAGRARYQAVFSAEAAAQAIAAAAGAVLTGKSIMR